MADVAAKDVAALRKLTGAGMMDCKKALTETEGDLDAAKDWLRERSLAGASKRAERSADQGAVEVVVESHAAALVELTAETDFVAKSDDFQRLLSGIAARVLADGDGDVAVKDHDGSTIGESIDALSGTLGEKIELGRVVRYETDDGVIDGYRHIQAERGVIGVLVELGGIERTDDAGDVAHDIALHIANSAPRYTTRDEIPSDIVAKEREVLENLTRNEGKPEAAIAKIVEGRINSFFKDHVLVEQPFVKDARTTIAELVSTLGPEAEVRRFVRVKIGEAEGE